MKAKRRYWVNTVSRDHIQTGVEGGFTQADHGKGTRLKRLNKDDLLVFYSPRTKFKGGKQLQAFTALATITDAEPYRAEMTPEFHPWRREVSFLSVKEAPIQPLIEQLSFITNKQTWGFPFSRGLFEIDGKDFEQIARAMGAKLP